MTGERVSCLLVPMHGGWGIITDRDLRSRVVATGTRPRRRREDARHVPGRTIAPTTGARRRCPARDVRRGRAPLPRARRRRHSARCGHGHRSDGRSAAIRRSPSVARSNERDRRGGRRGRKGPPAPGRSRWCGPAPTRRRGPGRRARRRRPDHPAPDARDRRLGDPPCAGRGSRWAAPRATSRRCTPTRITRSSTSPCPALPRPTPISPRSPSASPRGSRRPASPGARATLWPCTRCCAGRSRSSSSSSSSGWAAPTRSRSSCRRSATTSGRWRAPSTPSRLSTPRCGGARARPAFVRQLASRALDLRPPTGFLRDLVVEGKGEHAGRLDIKHGGITIVGNLARLEGRARRHHAEGHDRSPARGRHRGRARCRHGRSSWPRRSASSGTFV